MGHVAHVIHAKLPVTTDQGQDGAISPSDLFELSFLLSLSLSLDFSPFGTTPDTSLRSSDHVIWQFP